MSFHKARIFRGHSELYVSLPGNPYDGYTLAKDIEQKERLTETQTKHVCVDKGYKGYQVENCQICV